RAGCRRNLSESAWQVSDVPRVRPPRCAGRAHLAQTKRRQTLRGRSARGGTKAGVCDAGGAGGRPLQPKGRGHSVERQAELVCPRHPGPDGSPRSATFCLEAHEGYHDRSRVFARPHVVEARCGARCHPQGRWCGVNVLTPIGGVPQGRPSQGGFPQSSDVVAMSVLALSATSGNVRFSAVVGGEADIRRLAALMSTRPSVPLIPKFAFECAARVSELRNRDTSGARFFIAPKPDTHAIIR